MIPLSPSSARGIAGHGDHDPPRAVHDVAWRKLLLRLTVAERGRAAGLCIAQLVPIRLVVFVGSEPGEDEVHFTVQPLSRGDAPPAAANLRPEEATPTQSGVQAPPWASVQKCHPECPSAPSRRCAEIGD
jgi:hypothetical protein